jgi:SAM-dependent methyltransferase
MNADHESAPRSQDTADAAPDFDRLADVYRWMEWGSFGPFLGLCRSTFLPRLSNCHNALVLGDGDGRFTARLLRDNAHIRVHAIDASTAMLGVLTRACSSNANRLNAELADLRTWQPNPAPTPIYDLVVTHFFLDCLSTHEAIALVQRIRPIVAPGALWVVSEFAVPVGWFGNLVAEPILHCLYLAFGLLTGLPARKLPDYASALSAAGFTRLERRPRLGGLLVSELWEATGRAVGRSRG